MVNKIEGKIGVFSIALAGLVMLTIAESFRTLVPMPWEFFMFFLYPVFLLSGVITYRISDQALRKIESLAGVKSRSR